MRRCVPKVCFFGALGLFALSFLLPVETTYNGWSAMMIGLNVPFEGEMNPFDRERGLCRFLSFLACLANAAALIGFGSWLARKWRLALGSGFAALALALPLQLTAVWLTSDPYRELLGHGYWVWLSSFLVLALAGRVAAISDRASTFYE